MARLLALEERRQDYCCDETFKETGKGRAKVALGGVDGEGAMAR